MINEGKPSKRIPDRGRGCVIQEEFSKKNSTSYVGDGSKVGSIPDFLYRLLVPGILFIVFLFLAIFPSHSVTSASRIVRVGVYQNPPKVFINEKGEPDGFFVDLIKQIAKEEGWTLDFVPCDWETCLAKLRKQEIDLMTDVAYTPERDILFDFHRIPAAESWSRVYASPKTRINRIDQLNDKTLAVLKGSIQESIVGKTMAGYGFNVTIVTAPNLVEVFKLVQSGSAQAAVVNHFFGDYYYEDYGLTRTSVIINATTLYYATSYGINQDLLSAIDKHLSVWLDNPNSVYYSILNHWLSKSSTNKWLTYLTWGIVGIAFLLLLTSVWIFFLRRQVGDRTRHLEIANEKISESEEKYRLISTVTSDYMFSSKINEAGVLELNWVAGAFEAMTGYTLSEYIANGGWRATLYPEDYPLDDEDLEKLKANQNIIREIRTKSKDGSTSWVMVYAHPTWDSRENKLVGIYGAVQDITARKKAELKLEYANSLLNLTGKIAHVGGWEYDIQTEETEGTDEMFEIFEIERGTSLTLQEAIDFFAPEARELVQNTINECLSAGTPWSLELPFISARGRRKWVSAQGELEIKEGKPVRMIGAFQDITERKAIEEDIRRQTLHAEALVQTAAHITSRLELETVLKAVCTETARALSVPVVILSMVDTESKNLSIVADYGLLDAVRERKADTHLDEYPAAYSPTSNQPIIIEDLQTIPDMPNAELFQSMNLRTKVMVKIQNKGSYIGNLAVYSILEVRQFTDEEVNLLLSVANQAAQAITNARLFKNVEKQLRNIESLHIIDNAIANSMDVRLALKVVAEETMQRLGVDAVDILLYKPVVNQLECSVSLGFRTDAMKKVVLRMGEGFAGQIATDWQSIFVRNMRDYRESFVRAPEFTGEDFISYAGVPLRAKGQLIGVLEVFNRTTLNPDQEWFVFLETLAGQAAIAIESIRSFEEIQISNTKLVLAYDATIEGWSRAMDLRDKETEGHTQRVTELTIQMAHELEIPDQQIVHIRRGALLHDMGKLGIPDQILLKPGPLTDEEWVIMRKHPQYAYDMLSSIDYLRPALDIPYCHHEKWDGSGYPRGLKGEQIPIAARIFSIIDVWDALTSDRPYRPAWDRQRVIEYIENNSGMHFDPAIAKVFLHKITRDMDYFKGD